MRIRQSDVHQPRKTAVRLAANEHEYAAAAAASRPRKTADAAAPAGLPQGLYRKTVLENGIRVLTERMPTAESVSVGVIVEAGLHQEPAGQAGVAHLTEHLLFQGTSSRSAAQIAQLMDLAGGQVGAFTTRDYTCFSSLVLHEHCTYALDLLGDLLLNSTFPPDCLVKETAAILREIAGGGDQPSDRVHHLLKKTAWPDHPLGRPIAGDAESVGRLTREDVIYFFHRHYLPDRIIVAAAGQVDHADFVAQVRDSFWRLLGQGEARTSTPPTQQSAVALAAAPVAQAYFAIGLPAPAYAAPDRFCWHVLTDVIGGGVSSRLFRCLREERGLVYDVGAEYHAYRDGGMLVVEGSTSPEGLLQVLCITLMQLWRLALGVEPVEAEEVWKAKVRLRRQHLLAGENSSTRMSRLATQEFYFGRHCPAAEVVAAIEAVEPAALQTLAGGLLPAALRQAAVAVVGPHAPEQYSQAAVEQLLTSFA